MVRVYCTKVVRIFNLQNWSVKYGEQIEQTVEQYELLKQPSM